MNHSREKWVDNVKVFACVLVSLGHFFQSMVSSGILSSNQIYHWFDTTIYYFHVPLFFLCSGYLYQKTSVVNTFAEWLRNLLKKALALGVPYLFFSTITWVLKTLLSDSVNTHVSGLLQTLFFSPIAPYWYLYTLFFVFAITPTFPNRVVASVGLVIATTLKILEIFISTDVYAINSVMANEVWFVLGMWMCAVDIRTKTRNGIHRLMGCMLVAVFVIGSAVVFQKGLVYSIPQFPLALIACLGIVLIEIDTNKQGKMTFYFSKYLMPIFLMHTLAAAFVRVVLLRLGITQPIVHIFIGLTASFIGPIIAIEVMKKLKLDVLVYPEKVIRKLIDNSQRRNAK